MAVHMRCGDALAEESDEWGLLPLSAYLATLRERDHVALLTAAYRGSDKPFADVCKATAVGVANMLSQHASVSVFFNEDPGLDLARLAFADAVLCGPSSTFCLWGALAAAGRGAEASISSGRLLMNGSRPKVPGLRWLDVPRLAKGTEAAELLRFIEEN